MIYIAGHIRLHTQMRIFGKGADAFNHENVDNISQNHLAHLFINSFQ